jgi:hypothetical protein
MSKFLGRRFTGGGDGYSDHGQLSGLLDDDHPQYLITTAIRTLASPLSGIEKTGTDAGNIFSLTNAGTGAALFIQQIGTTDAYAAAYIENSNNDGSGLSVISSNTDPSQPLVQFSATSSSFDEAVLSLTHPDVHGLSLEVFGDGYLSGHLYGTEAVRFVTAESNPIPLGEPGVYIKKTSPTSPGEFYFVDKDGNERTWTVCDSVPGDGYFPFVEVDELEITGSNPGTLQNIHGYDQDGALIRRFYNNFLIGDGYIEIKGLTLRSPIDNVTVPEITYNIIKDPTIVNDAVERTIISGGTLVKSNVTTTETEEFDGSRKDAEIRFTTGSLDLGDPYFIPDSYGDGYYAFVFSADHTLDTKTIVIERNTTGPIILSISFTYPTCTFTGAPQTAVRAGQTFPVSVTTSTAPGDSPATFVQVDAGDAIQSTVVLTETAPGSGVWQGTVTARTGQPNGLADINVTAKDLLFNEANESTTTLGDPLVLFDNDFPVIESFEEGSDIVYPDGQECLKFGESADAYMTVSDFTEILYSSPNSRFTIDNPTTYEEQKNFTWDVAPSGIEENADILGGLPTTNMRIRARKGSNCSETTRNMQVRLDDTPPRVTSVRWRRNNVGSYNLQSPTLGIGTHGVRFIFNDPLVELPTMDIVDGYKGTLSALSGAVPGTVFYATHTIDGSDTNGCSELILLAARNCSNKQPLDADPIDGTQEEFCVDVITPEIIRVEIDIDPSDGYWNDGYDGYNQRNDDINNQKNIEQGCEVDFSSAVQTITAPDILTRHGEDVTVTVEVKDPIETGDQCVFDASPWGASASTSVAKYTNYLYQNTFVPNLGSLRNDDQGRDIGRPSIWHPSGNDATVTDLATNSDSATNTDVLSASGVDNVASEIYFTSDGTVGGTFQVSTDSFRAFLIGRRVRIVDDNTSATVRTVTAVAVNGTITVDGGSLASYTTAQNARAVPYNATDAEVIAWDTNKGLVKYINDGAFTQLLVCDWANPEAFSQHLTDAELEQNNSGTIGVDLFRAAFWGSKLSVPNTNGGTEQNPTGVANSKYVWRSKRLRLTTNPTGVQGTNLRFMVFGFSAGTQFRNVNITSTADWDQNSSRFDLNNNDSQIDIRISVDDPYAAGIEPITSADWYLTTDFRVSPQSGFKFGPNKDINIVFDPPATDVIDKDIYVEITLHTNSSGKAPQVDLFAFSFLA